MFPIIVFKYIEDYLDYDVVIETLKQLYVKTQISLPPEDNNPVKLSMIFLGSFTSSAKIAIYEL